MTETILSSENISLIYDDGARRTYAVRDVSIEIPPRQFIGIMGPSGSGKSSLLYVLSGLKRASEGDVRLGDFSYAAHGEHDLIALRRQRFGFVFQQPYLLSWQTAYENVIMGAPVHDVAAERLADEYFDHLGITALKKKLPSQISGGEKQRVCVARAMMNHPDVIFADEPTASLDHANGHLVIDLLSSYRDRGTVVVVTHDPEMLTGADQILLMRDGQSQGWRTSEDVLSTGAQSKTVAV